MAITKTHIEKSLDALDKMYLKETSTLRKNLCSKLAILELSGWVEDMMTGILKVDVYARVGQDYKNRFHGNVEMKPRFQFNDFLAKCITCHGLKKTEKIELCLHSKNMLTPLRDKLKTLEEIRNELAHTHLHPHNTPTISAPSVIRGNFHDLYPMFQALEKCVRKHR
jgi:hypothetical protein